MIVSMTIQKWWAFIIFIIVFGLVLGLGIGIGILVAKTVWGAEISQTPAPETELLSSRGELVSPAAAPSAQPAPRVVAGPSIGPTPAAQQPAAQSVQQNLLVQSIAPTPVKNSLAVAFVDSLAVAEEAVPAAIPPKEWPKIEVEWYLIDPPPGTTLFTKMNDGFYTGTNQNADYGSQSTPENYAYATRILHHFKDKSRHHAGFVVAAARDPSNRNIVLASLGVLDDWETLALRRQGRYAEITADMIKISSYLFLSLDGEKTWYELNQPPIEAPWVGTSAVRVIAEGNIVYLAARDNTIKEIWYGATISKPLKGS